MTKAGIDKARPEEAGERGRYRLFGSIGSGGMGSVHIGRLLSSADFARTVAIKRPLPELSRDTEFRAYIRREARVASRVHHPNVVATLDVVEEGDELWVVMEYVHGPSLAALLALARERGERLPISIGLALVADALRGLEAVHGARDEGGEPLGIIHRDVSPHNILCGMDGSARIADFGLARAEALTSISHSARFKGKLAYASPEQADARRLTPSSDVYSMGVVLWEVLTGRRLYRGTTPTEVLAQLLTLPVPAPSAVHPSVPAALDAVVLSAVVRDPSQRSASASAMLTALRGAAPAAPVESVAEWLRDFAGGMMAERTELLIAAERQTTLSHRSAEMGHGLSSEGTPQRRGAVATELGSEGRSSTERLVSRDGSRWLPSIRRALGGRLILSLLSIAVGASLALFAADTFFAHSDPAAPPPLAPISPKAASPATAGTATSTSALVPSPPSSESPVNAAPLREPPSQASQVGSRTALTPAPMQPRSNATRAAFAETPAAGNAECDPPYSVDADGIRHMRPGCQ